jgi:methionyl-tRNA formyltransferase
MALTLAMFGTAEFAVPILHRARERARVALAVSTPARPGARGRVVPSPFAQAAAALGIPVRTPTRDEFPDLAREIAAAAVDVLVVAAYGRILPPAVVAAAPMAVNVHPSLLPRHRGPAPVAWTLLAGDERTGVTLLGVEPEVDAAPVYDQAAVDVRPDEDRGALEGRLSELAANRLAALLERVERAPGHRLPGRPQEGEATYAPKLTAADEGLSWREGAVALVRRVRALAPRPGARARGPDGPILVLWAQACERPPALAGAEPGRVAAADDGFPVVATGDGAALRLERVRPAGRGTMDGDAYLRGRPHLVGARLEDGP